MFVAKNEKQNKQKQIKQTRETPHFGVSLYFPRIVTDKFSLNIYNWNLDKDLIHLDQFDHSIIK